MDARVFVLVLLIRLQDTEMCVAFGVQDKFPHTDNNAYHIVWYGIVSSDEKSGSLN